jgi:hypothetical protein
VQVLWNSRTKQEHKDLPKLSQTRKPKLTKETTNPMATRRTRISTLVQRRINFPEIPPPPPTNEESILQSTPRLDQEDRKPRTEEKPERDEDKFSEFNESETRGSHHPSHMEEYNEEEEFGQAPPDFGQAPPRRNQCDQYRTPDDISELNLQMEGNPTDDTAQDRLITE